MPGFMEILRKESPFFIKDLVDKYDEFKGKNLWNYIRYHQDRFKGTPVKSNKIGRPPIQYEVIE